MTDELKKTINDHYQAGNSIQAIARTFRLTVDEVLDVLGMDDMKTVEFVGDLVDQSEVGLNTPILPGDIGRVNYDLE